MKKFFFVSFVTIRTNFEQITACGIVIAPNRAIALSKAHELSNYDCERTHTIELPDEIPDLGICFDSWANITD
jgi:hypothetical protein